MKSITALVATTLLSCQSAFALTAEDWGRQWSVAVGQTTLSGIYFRLFDDLGESVPGVGYSFTVDANCATFNDGSTTFTGVSDEFGIAGSPTLIGHTLAAACEATFVADGLAAAVTVPTFVFNPADVVLTASPAALPDVPLCRTWRIAVLSTVGGIPVVPHALEVGVTVGPNGATATLDEVGPILLSGGTTRVTITSNDKQGRYELLASYGGGSVSVPIDQKKHKGDCLF